jgi:anti-anti-sigma factor
MSCKIRIRKHNGMPVLHLAGEVTAKDAPRLSKKLESLAKSSRDKIIIDLSETLFIDSYGLGAFIYSWRVLEKMNRSFVFVNPQDMVRDIFSGTNLNHIFTTVDSIEKL